VGIFILFKGIVNGFRRQLTERLSEMQGL
jgi:hypothetical protein